MKIKNKIIFGIFLILVLQIILVNVSGLTINSLTISPNVVKPGNDFEVSITLENNEDKGITDVVVSADINGLPLKLLGSSESFADEIDDDEQENFYFSISVLENAETGVYNIPIEINYKDSDNLSAKRNTIATITISSPPIISVEKEDSTILKGENTEISIKIINKGLADVKFLEIELGSFSGGKLISSSNSYIGDVDSNDYQTSQYNIFVNADAPNIINIPVYMIYKDSLNKEYSAQENLNVRVYSLEDAYDLGLVKKSNLSTIIFFIILLIVIYIIYRIIKRIRKNKKEN